MGLKKIAIFIPHFHPGFKYGGVMVSVQNAISLLSNHYQFYVFTLDRDMGDTEPYSNIQHNQWNESKEYPGVKIYYFQENELSLSRIKELFNSIEFDCIHLNSFFDSFFTLRVLMLLKMRSIRSKKVILSPRGEFGTGSLHIKYFKKFLYIRFLSFFRILKDTFFHVATELEKKDLKSAMNLEDKNILIAIDPPKMADISFDLPIRTKITIVYIARISIEKNLHYAIESLMKVRANLCFNIYGIPEQKKYFKDCQNLAKKLPANIICNFKGPLEPDHVSQILFESDILYLPSTGENYGHVIAESLLVGTKVLISDRTPWTDIEKFDLGWICMLQDMNKFTQILEKEASQFNSSERNLKNKERIRKKSYDFIFSQKMIEDNKKIYS